MDLQTKDNIQPFAPDIFTLPPYNGTQPVLLGGFCPGCRNYFFPAPRFCPECLGRIEKKGVGSKGKIYSFTIVRTPPPFGLPSPYGIGYITLAQTGLQVLGLFDPEDIDDLEIDAGVVLSVKPLGCDKNGLPQLRPCFALETAKE